MGFGDTACKMGCAGAAPSYLTCLVLTVDSSSGEVDEAMKGNSHISDVSIVEAAN